MNRLRNALRARYIGIPYRAEFRAAAEALLGREADQDSVDQVTADLIAVGDEVDGVLSAWQQAYDDGDDEAMQEAESSIYTAVRLPV